MRKLACVILIGFCISLPSFADDKKPETPAAESKPKADPEVPASADFKAVYDEYVALGHLIDEETAALSALQSKQATILTKLRAAMPQGKNYDPAKNAFTPQPEPTPAKK